MESEGVPRRKPPLVGLTYNLRNEYLKLGFSEEEIAEFDSEETIISLEKTLINLGYSVEKIGNLENLIILLTQGKKWDFVFNIAEGLYGYGREAQIPAILDAYRIPYTFSDPLTLSVSLNKAWAKRIVKSANLETTDFIMIEDHKELCQIKEKIYNNRLEYPLFVKPVACGTGVGVSSKSRVSNILDLEFQVEYLLNKYKQPVIIEPYLPGREFTIGILGTGENSKIIGAMEILLKEYAEEGAYSYFNKENCEQVVQYIPVNDHSSNQACKLALNIHKLLGCRDASRVDIRLDEKGTPQFLEINPIAGLHPTHSDLPMIATMYGISYENLINQIINSLKARTDIKVHAQRYL